MTDDYIDPRVTRSKQALADALLRLCQERGYQNITIQALIEEAQLGYATFHRHYRSIDDLLNSLIKPAWQILSQRIAEQNNLYDESLTLFRFVREYQDLYRIYLSLPRIHPVRVPIDKAALDFLMARYERHNDTKVPFDFSVMVVEAITGRLIHLYLDNIDKYTPEEMADMHFDVALKGSLNTLQLRPGVVLAPESLFREERAS